MSYATLHDPNLTLDHQASTISANVLAKFCSLGMVTSSKWFPCYITIQDGILRLYDEQNTVAYNPLNTVLEIPLEHTIHSSAWNRKDYSKSKGSPAVFSAFYITQDSLFGQQQRLLKIGSPDFSKIERIIRCVEHNTRNLTV
jgi:hypothetical protein